MTSRNPMIGHAAYDAADCRPAGQYEFVKGEVIDLPGRLNPANIDLLRFKTPFNGDPRR